MGQVFEGLPVGELVTSQKEKNNRDLTSAFAVFCPRMNANQVLFSRSRAIGLFRNEDSTYLIRVDSRYSRAIFPRKSAKVVLTDRPRAGLLLAFISAYQRFLLFHTAYERSSPTKIGQKSLLKLATQSGKKAEIKALDRSHHANLFLAAYSAGGEAFHSIPPLAIYTGHFSFWTEKSRQHFVNYS